MHISNLLSPYKGTVVSVSPDVVLDTINSIFIMYFVLLPLCQKEAALKYLSFIFILAGAYYIYWANSAYFGQEWYRFVNNRLVGPAGSPYNDANVLSTLIVMCVPFMIFLFFKVEHKIVKIILIFMVPMAWHAMILFSSRGALLASVISLLAVAYVVRSAKVNMTIGIAFFLFIIYQGAVLLDRTTETIELAQTSNEEPLNPRLISWEAGFKLIPSYPLFGAGVQMYEAAAANHFPGKTPHVAHNTFLNFSVNTGLPAGLMFLCLIGFAWGRLKAARGLEISFDDWDYYILVSSSVSILGYFVCSMFLDLIIFEPFYIVLVMNLISNYRLNEKFNESEAVRSTVTATGSKFPSSKLASRRRLPKE